MMISSGPPRHQAHRRGTRLELPHRTCSEGRGKPGEKLPRIVGESSSTHTLQKAQRQVIKVSVPLSSSRVKFVGHAQLSGHVVGVGSKRDNATNAIKYF